MNALQFYEHTHGTGADSENLNKDAAVALMEAYLQHKINEAAQQNDSHMASNNHSPVSTGESY